MAINLPKVCAAYLRSIYSGLGSGHAHELVAAYFGYKSSIALHQESRYSVDYLKNSAVIMPAVYIIEERVKHLDGLPNSLPPYPWRIARDLSSYLRGIGEIYGEEIDSFETYLHQHLDWDLPNLLSGEIALTNANGFDEAYYDAVSIDEGADEVSVHVSGTFSGDHDWERDRPFHGDVIDMRIEAQFPRAAGRIGYSKPSYEVTGDVRDPYASD